MLCVFEQNYRALIHFTAITSLHSKPGTFLGTMMVEKGMAAMANMTQQQSCARFSQSYLVQRRGI